MKKPPVEKHSSRPFGKAGIRRLQMTSEISKITPSAIKNKIAGAIQGGSLPQEPDECPLGNSDQREDGGAGSKPSVMTKRIAEAISQAVARLVEIVKAAVAQSLPTNPAELLDLERKLHQDVAKECVDLV